MYLNLIQIAESFGVEERIVEGWVREEGLPHTEDRGRLLFDRSQVADWAARRGMAARAGFLAVQPSALGGMGQLGDLLRRGGIYRDVAASDLVGTYDRILDSLTGVTKAVRQLLSQRLRSPGGVTLAPIGEGFALPHPTMRLALGRDSGTVALILLRPGERLAEATPDEVPISRLLFFIAPSPRAHLELLGQLTRSLAGGALREVLLRESSDTEILRAADLVASEVPAASNKRSDACS